MTDAVRTPDERFAALDWPFEPHYLTHPDGLRQHYVDERPTGASGGRFLLLHGEPTWAYLYRDWIARWSPPGSGWWSPTTSVSAARTSRPTTGGTPSPATGWRSTTWSRTLDLRDIHLVVQDWGGPIGLCTADAELGRYHRVFILNTWLHTARIRVLRGRPELARRGGRPRGPGWGHAHREHRGRHPAPARPRPGGRRRGLRRALHGESRRRPAPDASRTASRSPSPHSATPTSRPRSGAHLRTWPSRSTSSSVTPIPSSPSRGGAVGRRDRGRDARPHRRGRSLPADRRTRRRDGCGPVPTSTPEPPCRPATVGSTEGSDAMSTPVELTTTRAGARQRAAGPPSTLRTAVPRAGQADRADLQSRLRVLLLPLQGVALPGRPLPDG